MSRARRIVNWSIVIVVIFLGIAVLGAIANQRWGTFDGSGPAREAATEVVRDLASGKSVYGFALNRPQRPTGSLDSVEFNSVIKSMGYEGKRFKMDGTARFSDGLYLFNLTLVQNNDRFVLSRIDQWVKSSTGL
jgi:hypothetical protein